MSISTERFNEIFSKEVLSTSEVQELLQLPSASQASTLITQIKRSSNLLNRKGYIHVMDYFVFFKIDPTGRYSPGIRLAHEGGTAQ